MSASRLFNWQENLVAAVAGTGLILAIVAGLLIGFGDQSDGTGALAMVGLVLVGLGIALWFVLLQPWENFDDLQTPYYTGHHHEADHAHDDDHAEVAAVAAVVATHAAEAEEVGEAVDVPAALEEHPAVDEAPAAEAIELKEELAGGGAEDEAVAEVEDAVEEAVVADDPDREDDLKLIEGIGPKTEEALKGYGIKTFAAVAVYDPKALETLVKEELKVRLVGSTVTWTRQAKLAAEGDETALSDLQQRIKSGYLYDDLTLIQGIGEQSQDALYEAKIRAFEDLADASIEDIGKALKKADITGARHVDTWAQQAQFLVDNDASGLEAFKATL